MATGHLSLAKTSTARLAVEYIVSDGAVEDSVAVSTSFNVYSVLDSPDFNEESAVEIENGQEDGIVEFTVEDLLSGYSDKRNRKNKI